MSELTDVLAAITTLGERGERMALATIVSVRGSTYRRPGARLLVPEEGAAVGNVSGGCLEGDIERIGREVMAGGEPRLELFDLTADGDEVWGYGLGCNGAQELFIEPAEHAIATAAALRAAIDAEQPCSLVTVLTSTTPGIEPGARLLRLADGSISGSLGKSQADAGAVRLADAALAIGESTLTEFDGLRLFVEVLEPPPRLLICGAGHDAIPLVRFASGIGWRVTVTDVRDAFLNAERFPEAVAFSDIDPARVAELVEPRLRTYALLMSHNYLRDIDYLRSLLDVRLEYLGALGPRKRTIQLLRELDRVDAIDRLHAPAGLDIGAEGPEEVAWAIVAEMLAVRRGRGGGFLRDRRAPIHLDSPEYQMERALLADRGA
jgi:xanthine/CO dehydrogenase XdhC/CoxF family maturation factor